MALDKSATDHTEFNMTSVEQRKQSFKNWFVNIESSKMAKAGFFFEGKSSLDAVECFDCHHVFVEWDEDDDPEYCHKIIAPDCPYVQTLDVNMWKFFDMNEEKNRFRSLNYFPHDFIDKKILAEIGFFYVGDGINDEVECLYCGVAFSSWEKRDDPNKVHETTQTTCKRTQNKLPDEGYGSWDYAEDMTVAENRQKTFENLKSQELKEALADSGLYISPQNEKLKCFACNHSFEQSIFNENSEPDELHEILVPNCPYMLWKIHQRKLSNLNRNTIANLWKDYDMMIEKNRLKTLENWPVFFIRSTLVAASGLYYVGDGRTDEVRCVSCEVSLVCWKLGEKPDEKHSESSPECPFLRYKSNPSFEYKPLLPHFGSMADRHDSFRNWPVGMSQTSDQMAEAGFIYEDFGDVVKCYYCALELNRWRPGEIPEIPIAQKVSTMPSKIVQHDISFNIAHNMASTPTVPKMDRNTFGSITNNVLKSNLEFKNPEEKVPQFNKIFNFSSTTPTNQPLSFPTSVPKALDITSSSTPKIQSPIQTLTKPNIIDPQNKLKTSLESQLHPETPNHEVKANNENKTEMQAIRKGIIKSMLVKEVNSFKQELFDLLEKCKNINTEIGSAEEMNKIATILSESENPLKNKWSDQDIKKQVAVLKHSLISTCAFLAEAKMQPASVEFEQLSQLDPVSADKMLSIKLSTYYIESQLEQISNALDEHWEIFQKECKKKSMALQGINDSDYMKMPTLDKIYQPLLKQSDILSKQQAIVSSLEKSIASLKLPKKSGTEKKSNMHAGDDSSHGLSMRMQNINLKSSHNITKSDTKGSFQIVNKKNDALRTLLKNHKTVTIKPTKVEVPSILEILQSWKNEYFTEETNKDIKVEMKTNKNPSVEVELMPPSQAILTSNENQNKQSLEYNPLSNLNNFLTTGNNNKNNNYFPSSNVSTITTEKNPSIFSSVTETKVEKPAKFMESKPVTITTIANASTVNSPAIFSTKVSAPPNVTIFAPSTISQSSGFNFIAGLQNFSKSSDEIRKGTPLINTVATQPTKDAEKPSIDTKPAFSVASLGNIEPAKNFVSTNQKTAFDFSSKTANNAAVSSSASIFGFSSTSLSSTASSFGSTPSIFSSTAPTFSGTALTFSGTVPTFGNAVSTFGKTASTFGSTASTFGSAVSTFGSTSSTFGTAAPTFGTTAPTFGTTTPTFGTATSTFSTTAPTFTTTAPTFSTTAPTFGTTAPTFGTTATAFGSTASPLGSSASPSAPLFSFVSNKGLAVTSSFDSKNVSVSNSAPSQHSGIKLPSFTNSNSDEKIQNETNKTPGFNFSISNLSVSANSSLPKDAVSSQPQSVFNVSQTASIFNTQSITSLPGTNFGKLDQSISILPLNSVPSAPNQVKAEPTITITPLNVAKTDTALKTKEENSTLEVLNQEKDDKLNSIQNKIPITPKSTPVVGDFGFGNLSTNSTVFGGQPETKPANSNLTNSIFGGISQLSTSNVQTDASKISTPSAFTLTKSPTNIFGQPSTPNTCASALFGAANAAIDTSTVSLFGSTSITTSAPSIFKTPPTTAASVFGGQSTFASTGTSIFGGTGTTPFGQTQNSSVFGNAPAFGGLGSNTQSSNIFGTPANNVFGGANTSAPSVFGGSPIAKSTFGAPAAASPTTPQQSSIFGSPVSTGPGPMFGGSPSFGSKAVFGQPASFGSPSGSFGMFSGNEQTSVAQSGFGSPSSFGKPSEVFGRSPEFGSAPAFGSPPAFGASPAFGGGANAFSSNLNMQSGFGPGNQQSSTFESLATQSGLSFGNLAQQTQQAPPPQPAFQGSSSFMTWR